MRQLFLDKKGISIHEVAQPLLDDNLILVAVHYSFISTGTEAATIDAVGGGALFKNISQKLSKVLESLAKNGFESTKQQIKAKLQGTVMPLGYSCSGQIVAVGKKVKKFKVGDFVACAGAGFANHAEFVCVPENLTVAIKQEDLKDASSTTIGAIALQGIRRAQLQLGETVAIIGLGLLGQISVQLAKQAGCRVIGIDVKPERLELAQKLGADIILNAHDPEITKTIEFYTHHEGVDASIITAASHSNSIIQQAMCITRKKGKVVLVGDVGLGIERAPFYQKEIDFLISCSYGPGRYDSTYEHDGIDYPYAYVRWTENRNMQAFADLIATQKIDMAPLISGCMPLEEAAAAYAILQKQEALGMVLSYNPPVYQENSVDPVNIATKDDHVISFQPAKKSSLRVGIIGAGGFAQARLMPILNAMNSVSLNAIVDANIASAINSSRLYGAAHSLTQADDLFAADLCDVVVIASPHKLHCQQALNALRNGKAVFLEKPMVTDFEQFETITTFLQEHQNLPFCVDYNRSFSPYMRKIKKELAARSTPIIAHYRMNAGFIPKTHWVQTDVGAGRIIGEACHIFDLFCSLTDAQPVAISVETMNASRDDLLGTDNLSVQIRFSDGSLCTLLYTALGHQALGKERMEVFYDGKAIVMDDYTTLTGYGLPQSFNEKTTTPDKGHEFLLHEFFNRIQEGKPNPISLERLNTVAHVSLLVDQLANQGGGEAAIE